MDPSTLLDPHAARLVGLWHVVAEWDQEIVEYIRWLEDLRCISVLNSLVPVKDKPMKIRWTFMRTWKELEPNSVLRCRYMLGGSNWIRTFHFEGETLIIDVTQPPIEGELLPERKLFRCHRIAVPHLPEGVEDMFNRAMAKEWT